MRKLASVLLISATIFCSQKSFAQDKNFYFGGGYQISRLGFVSEQARGSYTTTEQVEVVDDDLTTVVQNPDGTTTTTTTTELVDQTVNHVGGYYDHGDYIADIFHNFNAFVGVNLGESVAVELGYFSQSEEKENNKSNQYIFDGKTAKSEAKLQIVSLDLVMNSPLIDDIANLNIIAGVSSVLLDTEIDFYSSGAYSDSSSESYRNVGLNLGIGVDTKLNDTFSIRTIVKGILIPNGEVVQNIVIASVGLKVSI